MSLVERIYQSLIYNNPTRITQCVNSIHGEFAEEGPNVLKKVKKDTPCSFLFEVRDNINLFGIDLKLYGITINFNVRIKDVKIDGNKYNLDLEDFSKEKKHFAALLYFKDEESMKFFRENTLNIDKIFNSAKDITEYID